MNIIQRIKFDAYWPYVTPTPEEVHDEYCEFF